MQKEMLAVFGMGGAEIVLLIVVALVVLAFFAVCRMLIHLLSGTRSKKSEPPPLPGQAALPPGPRL